jgi:hypothetical protein
MGGVCDDGIDAESSKQFIFTTLRIQYSESRIQNMWDTK